MATAAGDAALQAAQQEPPVFATIVVEMPRAGEEESRLATQKALRQFARMQPKRAQKLNVLRSLTGCLASKSAVKDDDSSDGDGYGRIVSVTPGPRYIFPKSATSPPAQRPRQQPPAARAAPAVRYPTLQHRLTPPRPRPRPAPKRSPKPAAAQPAPYVVQVLPPINVTVKYFRIGPPGSPRLARLSPKARLPKSPRSRSPSMSGTATSDTVSLSPAVTTRTPSSGSVAADLHQPASPEMQSEIQPADGALARRSGGRRSGGEFVRTAGLHHAASPGIESEIQPVDGALAPRSGGRRSGGEFVRAADLHHAARPEIESEIQPADEALARRSGGRRSGGEFVRTTDLHHAASPEIQPEIQPEDSALARRSGGRRSGGEYARTAEQVPAASHEIQPKTQPADIPLPGRMGGRRSGGEFVRNPLFQPAKLPAALDVKAGPPAPELLATSNTTAVAAPAIQDLAARSLPILPFNKHEGVHDKKASLDAAAARRRNVEGEDVLQRAARRVEDLLSRPAIKELAQEPSSPFAHRMNQDEAEVEAIGSPPVALATVQEAHAATEAWLQAAVAPASMAALAGASPASKPHELASPISYTPEQYQLAAQRSYSCASDASHRYLTHASSAAVEDLQSSDDDVEAGLADLEQQVQALRFAAVDETADEQVAQPRARPQLTRLVSFAVSVGSDAPSSGFSECGRSEGTAEEVQPEALAGAVVPPPLGRATSFAVSVGSQESSSSICHSGAQVVGQEAAHEVQAERSEAIPQARAVSDAASDAVTADSSDTLSLVSDGASCEAVQHQALPEVAASPAARLQRMVSFAVSVGSDDALTSEASAQYSSSSNVIADEPVAELQEAQVQRQQPQMARGVSFALSIGSNDAFSTASSNAFSRAGSSVTEDAGLQAKAAPAPHLARIQSYAISTGSEVAFSASSNCFSVATEAEDLQSQQLTRAVSSLLRADRDAKLATEPQADEDDKVAPAQSLRQLGRGVSFAVDVPSDLDTDSSAELAQGSPAAGRRQLGRLTSFAVEMSSGSDSSVSEVAGDAPPRRLAHLASFALDLGSSCSNSVSDSGSVAGSAQARRYGRVTSFAVPVASNGDSGSEAGDESEPGVCRAKSFAIRVDSSCESDLSA